MAGSKTFKKTFLQKITEKFQFSKMEANKFKYLGCEIEKLKNDDISLNQNEYIMNIEEVRYPVKINAEQVN